MVGFEDDPLKSPKFQLILVTFAELPVELNAQVSQYPPEMIAEGTMEKVSRSQQGPVHGIGGPLTSSS